MILAIGELGEQKGFVWACVSISCHREYAGIWHIEVIAQTTVGCVDWSNSESSRVKCILKKHEALKMSATETTNYRAGTQGEEQKVSVDGWTDFFLTVLDTNSAVGDLENEKIFSAVGESALESLMVLREVFEEYKESN